MPPGADCHYSDVALSLVDANLIFPFYVLNLKSLSDQIKQFPTDGTNCKDQIWFELKRGMDPGPQNPNNKFVEGGIKS